MLPVSFAEGTLYVTLYAIGLVIPLLLISLSLVAATARKLGWLADPRGWFPPHEWACCSSSSASFVIVGADKALQELILDLGWYDPIAGLEGILRGE